MDVMCNDKKGRNVTRQIGIELNINTDGLNELFQCPHIHVFSIHFPTRRGIPVEWYMWEYVIIFGLD